VTGRGITVTIKLNAGEFGYVPGRRLRSALFLCDLQPSRSARYPLTAQLP
jgi:hypothetical protein